VLKVLSVAAVLPSDSSLIQLNLSEPVRRPPPRLDYISASLPLLI
jgi:hypothetical protein